jgi:hypothetical protein
VSAGALVSAWLAAIDVRDLDTMVGAASPELEFHPLRFAGIRNRYLGHDALREWFAQLALMDYSYRTELSDVRDIGDGLVLCAGRVSSVGGANLGPFSAIHRVESSLIVSARHYLSDPVLLERLGIFPVVRGGWATDASADWVEDAPSDR